MTEGRVESAPERRGSPPRAGLRLQIVLALAGLLLLAFGPLFFAVASLATITATSARQESARTLGRAIAAHVKEAQGERARPGALERALLAHIGQDVNAVCFVLGAGEKPECQGAPIDGPVTRSPPFDSVRVLHGAAGRVLEIATPLDDGAVITQVRLDVDGNRAVPLVRPVALYMFVFALALLVFAYFALTRLIVRPVDQLVEAADRVASGARTLRVPKRGARELVTLGASFQAMAEKLIAEEAALLLKVRELTATTTRLTQTQEQLVRSERLASVGRLAAGLAHEIGNPIAALIGMLDLLIGGDLAADVEHDFLRRMRGETERIHAVVRDLLDFARPEESNPAGGPQKPRANVQAVIDDVIALVRHQKEFQNVKVSVNIEGPLWVTLPAPRLMQVLLNVVLNAGGAMASHHGGDGAINVRAHALGENRIRIEIEDDGPGIVKAVRANLFEPFVTTKPVGEGTGLGLAVCRGLVESAGGEIGFDGARTEGANIYLILPSAAPDSPAGLDE